ncbi:MAG TPA: RnfABCDGE type electron transport complex subunit D, partial [Gallionella sp.]|nr:RnfABCDGE type electron transport complex subunit D [Gallionella sp.]
MSIATIKKSGPFAHGFNTVQKTMLTVLLALTPATLFNLYLFGWPAILLFTITVGACVAVEAGCLMLAGRPVMAALSDLSAVLTGWLLAMSLPPWAPWWIGALAAIFAIALAKHPFGGIGQNVFNPAMVGRTVMLVSFPVVMTAWVMPHPLFSAGAPSLLDAFAITFGGHVPDTVSAASALGHVKTELSRGIPVTQSMGQVPGLMDMMLGYRAGSMGETSAILILAGGL